MAVELTEAEFAELTGDDDVKALVPLEPVRLSSVPPREMVAFATEIANALKDVVDRQRLFQVIGTKKYPMVEAWMTLGRMDNVVAREDSVTRLENGAYEARVLLVRLSDGVVVGSGSAICGGKGDNRWNDGADYARRSMAITRAVSKAFRIQYAWIMALAGYEPTPSEEMIHDKETERSEKRAAKPTAARRAPEQAEMVSASTPASDEPAGLPAEASLPTLTWDEFKRRLGDAGKSYEDVKGVALDLYGTSFLSRMTPEQLAHVAEDAGL